MPTLVLATYCDPVHPPGCAQARAKALPAATLRVVTSKAVDRPAMTNDVAAAVDTFVAGSPSSSGE